MAKKAADSKPPTFEASLSKLEQIVDDMESGELPLEEIIEKYEEGMGYLKVCDDKLAEAEVKIRKLTRDDEGELTEEDMPETD